jgi:hypothetical protein
MPMIVSLTQLEMSLARFVAEQRDRMGQLAGADDTKYGEHGTESLELHYRGCLGELAFAKSANVYWSGAGNDFSNEEDVGSVQVRTTSLANGSLIVRPNELQRYAERPWALVIGSLDTYRIAGWIYGREAGRRSWLRDPNGRPAAYFVPQGYLHRLPVPR